MVDRMKFIISDAEGSTHYVEVPLGYLSDRAENLATFRPDIQGRERNTNFLLLIAHVLERETDKAERFKKVASIVFYLLFGSNKAAADRLPDRVAETAGIELGIEDGHVVWSVFDDAETFDRRVAEIKEANDMQVPANLTRH